LQKDIALNKRKLKIHFIWYFRHVSLLILCKSIYCWTKEYLLHTTDSITRNSVRNLSLRRPTSALCFVDRNKLQSASSRLPRSYRVMPSRVIYFRCTSIVSGGVYLW